MWEKVLFVFGIGNNELSIGESIKEKRVIYCYPKKEKTNVKKKKKEYILKKNRKKEEKKCTNKKKSNL